MRLSKHNRLDYLHNKRLLLIQKSRLPLQIRLQMIHNNAIDERVFEYYDDVPAEDMGGVPSYNESKLTAEYGALNQIATSQDFKRLLSHSLIDADAITKLQIDAASTRISNTITQTEVTRTLKNLDHITQVLDEVTVDIGKYRELVDKLPRQVSRLDILQKAVDTGKNFKGRALDTVKVDKRGYTEIGRLSRDLEKYRGNAERLDIAKQENQQSQREGHAPLNQSKVWIWSQLERTRHEGMDGETVGLYEKFTVVNEQTGDTDYLRFPGDIENDNNGCSNICNCGCSYTIE